MFLNALLLKAGCAIVIIRKLAAQAGMGNLQIVSSVSSIDLHTLSPRIDINYADYSGSDAHPVWRRINEESIPETEKEKQRDTFRRVIQFCVNNVDCRRRQVLGFFGEVFDSASCRKGCDNCRDTTDIEKKDMRKAAVDIINLAKSMILKHKERITRIQFLDVIRGAKSKGADEPLFGCGKALDRACIERIVDHLEMLEVFMQESMQTGKFHSSYMRVRQHTCGRTLPTHYFNGTGITESRRFHSQQ